MGVNVKVKIRGFTLINEPKLTFEGRKILKRINDIFSFETVRNVTICSKDFDILLKAVLPSYRDDCKDLIPYQGKQIVRGK